jgi:hypothetical protein
MVASMDAFVNAMLRRLRSLKVNTSWNGGIMVRPT